jgi:dCMP deaminase
MHKSTDLISHLQTIVAELEERPSWSEYFMGIALLLSTRSSCQRLRVGCVFVSSGEHKNRIIAAGYNGYLPGLPHRSQVREGHEQATVHAEQNGIADAARRGVSVDNSTVYITHYPCVSCAKTLLAAGVTNICYHFDYNNDHLVADLLAESKIPIEQF